MNEPEAVIFRTLQSLLQRRDDAAVELARDSRLFEDLDLDSLEVAELSAALEDELGRDPFSEGLIANTVGELLAFYGC